MDVEGRIAAVNRINDGFLSCIDKAIGWNPNTIANFAVHNAVLAPTLLYGRET